MMKLLKIKQTERPGYRHRYPHFQRQDGVALIVSMILLAVITLLSVTAMRGTNLDAKIAANHQHKQVSFQAAENAFARLVGDDPQVVVPTASSGILTSTNYVSVSGVDGQPDSTADLDLEFIRQSAPGEFRFSGYSLDATALIYTADTYGSVTGSKARSHHRATIVLVRD